MSILKDFLLQFVFIATIVFAYQNFVAEKFAGKKTQKIILSGLFGLSVLLCMTFPVIISPDYRVDIRIVPLLLGTLYGGRSAGIFLSALIVFYRITIGIDMGLYTTALTLIICMPVILIFQKYFIEATKTKRIRIALLLLLFYSIVGMTSVWMLRGITIEAVFRIHFIHILINTAAVWLFTYINETVRETIENNKKLQAHAKDAEIAFLRSQIKPHFLYNTLNSIAVLCTKEPRLAEELTLEFSQYLRRSFDFKQLDSLATIENEWELIKAYLNIEKVRFGAKLNVEYDVDANLDMQIPPLILQPLVENAVRHGLMSNWRGGTVKLTIREDADHAVRFIVEDDGCGMSESKRQEILRSDVNPTGVGLWNISQRIRLIYGESIHIESAEGAGTKVFFRIPAKSDTLIGG